MSAYESSVCNTVRKLCQLRDNLYSCDICIDMALCYCNVKRGLHRMTLPFYNLYFLYFCIEVYVKMCTLCTNAVTSS